MTTVRAPVPSQKTLLAAEALAADPRIAEARRLVLAAVAEHSASIAGIRPRSSERAEAYDAAVREFGALRGGDLYFPYLASGIGNGPFVELGDGSVKLDFITGIGVHGLGHSHPRLIEASLDAAINDTPMQGNLQQGFESLRIARELTRLASESGAPLEHCFLSSSGAMANENALKLAFQRNAPSDRVLAFEGCFAGRTLALAAVTDKAAYRVGLPRTLEVDLLPFFDHRQPEESTLAAVRLMRRHLARFPKAHACLWMEVVQGEGGYYPGEYRFFKALADLARENHIAVIIDEVQSFARTSRPFAFQHFQLDPLVDIVTVGKITQVCATLFTADYKPKPGLISQTFTASSQALMTARAVLASLSEQDLFGPAGKNVKICDYFRQKLDAISHRQAAYLQGPWGVGTMIAFTPGDGRFETAKELVKRLYDAGVMSFTAGANPSRVRFLVPPCSTQFEHIDLACSILESVIEELRRR